MTETDRVPTVADMPIRCAIVNDYEVIVRGLAQMIDAASSEIAVVELDSGTSVAESVDIALYDTFAQPPDDGPGVADLLANPLVDKVVVYTWNTRHHQRTSRERGIAGFLSKGLTGRELVDALCRIHAGETVGLSPDDASTGRGDWPGRRQGLAPRESEVIAFITQGLSNREIAAMTGLSPNSIKTYIRSSYRKMGVTSRAHAVLWGIEHGFFPDRLRIKDPENA